MGSRRHAVFVTPQFGRETGGLGVSAERIVGHLRNDFDLVVLVPDKGAPPGSERVERAAGLELVRYGAGGETRFALQGLADRVRRCLTGESRLLGFYLGELSYAAALVAAEKQRPAYLFARGNDVDLEPFGAQAFSLWHSVTRAERVFCVTRELEARLRAFAPGVRTQFIPNGVDGARFPVLPARTPGSRLRLGLFGDIKPKKGLEFLLEAVDFTRYELVIAGTLRDEMAKLLHGAFTLRPELMESIRHLPFVKSVPELLERYADIDIVCLPSHHEGMSNVLLEAMSTGKASVCSAVGGALDVVRDGENGFLFADRDRDSFAAALARAETEVRSGTGRVGGAARNTTETELSWDRERSRYREALAMDS